MESFEVFEACCNLKYNKKYSDLLLHSSAFFNAPYDFLEILCFLINTSILHGHSSFSLLSCIVIPLLKISSLDYTELFLYIPITLSSLWRNLLIFLFFIATMMFFSQLMCNLILRKIDYYKESCALPYYLCNNSLVYDLTDKKHLIK